MSLKGRLEALEKQKRGGPMVALGGGLIGSRLPDSGDRTAFDTGAVRDACEGKGLPSEIPPCALRRIALRFGQGAVKYERGNWRKGIPITRYLDAIARHSWAFAEGATDEDHAGAVAWNSVAMIWTLEEIEAGRLPKELDDRPFLALTR